MTEKMKIGFIGNGKGSNRYHIPFILTRKDTMEIKWIYARHINHDVWPAVEGARYTTDINDLLNDPELDLIVISTPHDTHYSLTKQVIESGHNVVCDKPFCNTADEARDLFELGKKKGVMVQCYQNRRFDSDFLTAQKVLESGKIGDLLEVEMSFDYYRPQVPESVHFFNPYMSYLYGHACHTLDQVISYWGTPDSVHYDVRQLLGEGRMNDYFDIDLFYGRVKVSVKSSYFRVKERPSFVLYGTRGMFVKREKDRQEADLKKFYLPDRADFGLDLPEHYGTLTYYDAGGVYHEEKVPSARGDYGRYYDALRETLLFGAPPLVTEEQTMLQMELLEEGAKGLR